MCAGLAGPIPALYLLNQDYSTGSLMLWGISVGFLGIFFAGAQDQMGNRVCCAIMQIVNMLMHLQCLCAPVFSSKKISVSPLQSPRASFCAIRRH